MGRRKRMQALIDKYTPIYQRSEIFWPSDRDAGVKEAEPAEQAGREELDVNVVHLNYRDQPNQISDVLEALRVGGNSVDREAEDMLTVRLTPYGEILSLTAPPGRHVRGLGFQEDQNATDELPVDVFKSP